MVVLILALLEHPEHVRPVRLCLEAAGHEVCIVNCFSRAKAILEGHPFDLIISDVHLENGGSVFDFLKWVRENPRSRTTPFVLFSLHPSHLSRYLAEGVQTAARYLGANKFVNMEEFDAAVLAGEIAELLPGRGFPKCA